MKFCLFLWRIEGQSGNHVGSQPQNYLAAGLDWSCLHKYKSFSRTLTLCMLGNFFKYLFLSKFSKNSSFPPIFFCWYIIWMSNNLDLRWSPTKCGASSEIQIVCIGHQRSSKFTASGLRVNKYEVICANPAYSVANSVFLNQPFPDIYIHSLFLNCAEARKVISIKPDRSMQFCYYI